MQRGGCAVFHAMHSPRSNWHGVGGRDSDVIRTRLVIAESVVWGRGDLFQPGLYQVGKEHPPLDRVEERRALHPCQRLQLQYGFSTAVAAARPWLLTCRSSIRHAGFSALASAAAASHSLLSGR